VGLHAYNYHCATALFNLDNALSFLEPENLFTDVVLTRDYKKALR